MDSRCSPVPPGDRERAEGDSRGPSARASLQLPRRRVKLRGERTRGRGAWSERGGGEGGGEARTRGLARHPRGEGRGGGPGGDSCLMVPSARLLQAALGCLLGSRALACGAALVDLPAVEFSETGGLGALEEISAETRVPVQPALWGSQKGQCITNHEMGEGFAQYWGVSSRLKAGVRLRSPAGGRTLVTDIQGFVWTEISQ